MLFKLPGFVAEVLQAGSPNVTISDEMLDAARLNEKLQEMMGTFDADGDGKI